MKKISISIITAIMMITTLCAAIIYASTDPAAKLSAKLLEFYENGGESTTVCIYYEDTVELEPIEAEAATFAESKVEEMRAAGGYTEEQLLTEYNEQYTFRYNRLLGDAYYALGREMRIILGMEDTTRLSYYGPYIRGEFTYEEVLVIAENELVLSLTRTPEIEEELETSELETELTSPSDPTEPPTDAPDLLVGDVDEDGLITATDASNILILAAEMGLGYEPTFEELYAADYNADGKADATDASLILIFAAEEGVK